jgi:Protein of unknown function (DUF2889)
MTVDAPDVLPDPLDDSLVGTLPRRPGSARRTSSIDMTWPGGAFGSPLHLEGRARDLFTPMSGEPIVVGEAEMLVTVGPDRTIETVATTPARPGIDALIGAKGGTYLRTAIDAALPGERQAATPLHLLLDDVAGASLVAGAAWIPWFTGTPSPPKRADGEQFGVRKGRIICSGLRPDGSAQTGIETGQGPGLAVRRAGDLGTAADPWGWHEFPEHPPVCMRRHRRVDVRPDGDILVVEAFFRDSFWNPDGTEMAMHEYTVDAEVDAEMLTLRSVHAHPRVLPFPECQWAAPHVDLLIGLEVTSFRTEVQSTLFELKCCTHLNDMLRGLAEVPSLVAELGN